MQRNLLAVLTFFASFLGAVGFSGEVLCGKAYAQYEDAQQAEKVSEYGVLEAPLELPPPSLTLPAGSFSLDGLVVMNLSKGDIGEPISVSPDFWYGLTNEITLGLAHSFYGTTGMWGMDMRGEPQGRSLCLSAESGNCPEVYGNFSVLGRLQAWAGRGIAVAATAGLVANSIDPFALSVKLGAHLRGRVTNSVRVDFIPSMFIGLTERQINREDLIVPVTVSYTLNPRIEFFGQTGFVGSLHDLADSLAIPMSVGGSYALTEGLFLAGVFSMPAILGGDGVASNGVDGRVLTLALRWIK